jgi:S1-C subfamily serine protease
VPRSKVRVLAVVCVLATALVGAGGAASGAGRTAPFLQGVVEIDVTVGLQAESMVGEGIVVSSRGEVVTNNDLIDGATRIRVVEVANHHIFAAAVAGYSVTHDVALLRLRGASRLQTASLGIGAATAKGEKVTAALTAAPPSVATGKIVGLNQSVTAIDAGVAEHLRGLIETTVHLLPQQQRGPKGGLKHPLLVPTRPTASANGPLLDPYGRVIGIDAVSSRRPAETFAIPIAQADGIARAILAGRSSATIHIGATAFLGVEVTSHGGSVVIAGVIAGSPAARSGLAADDQIASLDGQEVTSLAELGTLLLVKSPGESVKLGWVTQAGKARTSTVRLASGPPK